MEGKQANFARGAVLLVFSGILVKIIGAAYRIPMTNLIGDQGIALYQYAYPIYTTLLALSTAGMPAAVSKLVSEDIERGDEARAHRVFRVSLLFLALIGGLSAGMLYITAPWVAGWVGDPLATLPIRAISPALFFVAVLSAYRGYFQGRQQMLPTALTQLVEQGGKLVIGLGLAWTVRDQGPQYAAAAAILGVTAAEAFAMIMVMGMGAKLHKRGLSSESREPFGRVLGRLLPIAMPMLLGSVMIPLVSTMDSFIVNRTLLAGGMNVEHARTLYGLLTGPVSTLANMPSVISLALSMALVPAISQACQKNSRGEVREKTRQALEVTLTLTLPAAIGLAVLSRPVMALLYGGLASDSQQKAAELLVIIAPSIPALALVQTLSGILQGMGKVGVPVAALAVGALGKLLVTHALTAMPGLNIAGAAIGTVVCYGVAAIIDLLWAYRILGGDIKVLPLFLRPTIAAAAMGLFLYSYLQLTSTLWPGWLQTMAGMSLGAIVYFVMLMAVGGLPVQNMCRRIRRWSGHEKERGYS